MKVSMMPSPLGVLAYSHLVLLCLYALVVVSQAETNAPVLLEIGEVKEYCQLKTFRASCAENEVIVISSGHYGRMKLGLCVHRAYGSLGCSIDVQLQMDRLCSGRQECEFQVSELHGSGHPCPTDLTLFLEASYYCQKVASGSPQGCASAERAITLTEHSGYLSNVVSRESGHGSENCPWRIRLPDGLRINVTLVNFARVTLPNDENRAPQSSSLDRKPNVCYQYAHFRETNSAANGLTVTECEGGRRVIPAVYLSTTSSVDITVFNKRDSDVYFMLYYQAMGCSNPTVTQGLWVQREEDTATVKCNTTGDSWRLRCVDHEWIGEIGNCTLPGTPSWHVGPFFDGDGFPYSILLVVAIGVALGVFLGGILLVCASKYFKRRREGQRGGGGDNFQQSLYGVEHGKVLASQFDDVGGGSPRNFHYHGVHVDETTTLPPADKSQLTGGCKCTFTSYGPPPGYHPATAATHTGTHTHMYESPQFDRKDSR